MVFSKFEIAIEQKGNKHYLTCVAYGEKLDYTRHEPRVDVKAVTMHMFKIEYLEDKQQWKAQVLLDI